MMDRGLAGASRRLRWGLLSLATVLALLATSADPADARSKRKRHQIKGQPHAESYRPPYADIVVDARTGAVLHEADADRLRHPASLAKIMTLYLLFERLEAGALRLDTPLDVSSVAAMQAPTKLGVKPGQTITVEEAIKALVTKSANDAAVVVAEAVAGSEDAFARLMTGKARALGMTRTTYRNASGLPNDEQVTTARDQALLGIAIQQRFPQYYKYFSTRHFVFRGTAMRNHNKLLGQVEGVDGIKTGYIRASGFNLVTSVRRDGRHIVAVVLGGRSSGQRDARMHALINGYIRLASTKSAAKVAEAALSKPTSGLQLAAAGGATFSLAPPPAVGEATAAIPAARPDLDAPIRPIPVKTVAVKLVAPKHAPADHPVSNAADPATPETIEPAQAYAPTVSDGAQKPSPPADARPGLLAILPTMVAAAGETAAPVAAHGEPRTPTPAPTRPLRRGSWAIQVGAFEDEADAKQRLSSAQSIAAKLLTNADAYTERTTKGDKTYYRARFAGLDRKKAEAACKQLKRGDIACMALKN
jgi:D-alanyl-D-alanine carboxypeptidase